jgi:hypothetical protein
MCSASSYNASEGLADVLNNPLSLLKSTNLCVNNCWSHSMCLTYWSLFILYCWNIFWHFGQWQMLYKSCEWHDNSIQKADTLSYISLTSWNFPCSLLFKSSKCQHMSVKKTISCTQLASSKWLTACPFSRRKTLSSSNCNRKHCRTLSLLS